MKALIIEGFTTKTGKILKIGDVIESEDGGIINRLIEKGRARLLPSGTHGDAPSFPDEGSSEAPPLPRGEEPPLPALFRAGDFVRFSYKTALDVREGTIIESKHHGPVIGWWYRIESGESKFWTSESHIQRGGVNATGS